MKYSRLTKEQFDSLSLEFINFLATQSITAKEWELIKTNEPKVAEEELDIFSDLVWEGVLSKVEFLENISGQQLFLFRIIETEMDLIVVKATKTDIDISSANGYKWLQENFASDDVEFFTATKAFSEDKNLDVFSLIQQGAVITKGSLYQFFKGII
ncbi:MAG: cag pathogenicity island protein 24 [Flavobacteriaceae bacterium]|jgi:cag pathogenicity island protein 24